MIFIIIILTGVFLWWKFRDSQSKNEFGLSTPKSSFISSFEAEQILQKTKEENLTVFILESIETSLRKAMDNCPDEDKEYIIYGLLLKLKQISIQDAPNISMNVGLPLPKVLNIIDNCFDRFLSKFQDD
jgi:hypothetical protein